VLKLMSLLCKFSGHDWRYFTKYSGKRIRICTRCHIDQTEVIRDHAHGVWWM